jgi:hypothetical protein
LVGGKGCLGHQTDALFAAGRPSVSSAAGRPSTWLLFAASFGCSDAAGRPSVPSLIEGERISLHTTSPFLRALSLSGPSWLGLLKSLPSRSCSPSSVYFKPSFTFSSVGKCTYQGVVAKVATAEPSHSAPAFVDSRLQLARSSSIPSFSAFATFALSSVENTSPIKLWCMQPSSNILHHSSFGICNHLSHSAPLPPHPPPPTPPQCTTRTRWSRAAK